jgi:aspartyl protease family protein
MLSFLVMNLFIKNPLNRNEKLKHIAIWIFIILSITIVYNNKDVLLSNFIPYKAIESDEKGIEIQKSNDGHFYIMLKVNDINVLFLIDTGATTTTLNLNDAKRIGIDTDKLRYNMRINTANGKAFAASSEINIKINNYAVDRLNALISKELKGYSLLGMNFLEKLKGYEIRKDKMFLYIRL